MSLFAEARYAWAIMIGNFRVFVANRFGSLSRRPGNRHEEPAPADRVLSRDWSDRHLAALARFEAKNTLEFQQGESLTNMRKISREWHDAYLAAAAIYSSERWRADVPLLRDYIQPLFFPSVGGYERTARRTRKRFGHRHDFESRVSPTGCPGPCGLFHSSQSP